MTSQKHLQFMNFLATVVAPTCRIDDDLCTDVELLPLRARAVEWERFVDLGATSASQIDQGGVPAVMFEVLLDPQKCHGAKTVQVYFDGITHDGVTLENERSGASAARNVGVQILDAFGNAMTLGQAAAHYPADTDRLQFMARLVGTQGSVTAGLYAALSECVIVYA